MNSYKSAIQKHAEVNKATNVKNVHIFMPASLREDTEIILEAIKNYQKNGKGGTFGSLFTGLQGTGKTTHVRYIAQEAKAHYFYLPAVSDPSEVLELYKAAREEVKNDGYPAIIHLDDIDYVGKRSEFANSQLVRSFQYTLDKDEKNSGVFTFLTSNYPEKLDESIRRAPRITFNVEFLPPTRAERQKIISAIIEDYKMEVKWDGKAIEYAAEKAHGYVAGDLCGFVEMASFIAQKRKSGEVSSADIDRAREKTRPSALSDMLLIEPKGNLSELYGDYIRPAREVMSMLASIVKRGESGMKAVIYGPPGNGKTQLALKTAGSFGLHSIYINAAEVLSKWEGEAAKMVERYFRNAKSAAPIFFIMDEASGIINRENPWSGEWLSVFKTKTSESIPGVFVILIDNDPTFWGRDILDRFQKIYLEQPNPRDLEQVLRGSLPATAEVDIASIIAKMPSGLTSRAITDSIALMNQLGRTITTERLLNHLGTKQATEELEEYHKIRRIVGDDVRSIMSLKE